MLISKLVIVIKKDIINNPEKWKQEKHTLEHVDNKTCDMDWQWFFAF
jgi:hypothetical protein